MGKYNFWELTSIAQCDCIGGSILGWTNGWKNTIDNRECNYINILALALACIALVDFLSFNNLA
jgi:hypothetical protein